MYTNEEIRRKFAMYASKIDEYEKWAEKMFVRKRRKQLLRKAYGNVLDVAVGTGKNLLHYPDGCDIIGLDYSPEMLVEAKKKGEANQEFRQAG